MKLEYIPAQLITIGGTPGAGKDKVAGILSDMLGYAIWSPSIKIRDDGLKMARDHGRPDNEAPALFQEWRAQNPDYDNNFDASQAELSGRTGIIAVSRLGHEYISGGLHFLLKVRIEEAGRRRFNDPVPGEHFDSVEDTIASLRAREKKDIALYKQLYGIDNFLQAGRYHYVINTTRLSPEQVAEKMLRKMAKPIPYQPAFPEAA